MSPRERWLTASVGLLLAFGLAVHFIVRHYNLDPPTGSWGGDPNARVESFELAICSRANVVAEGVAEYESDKAIECVQYIRLGDRMPSGFHSLMHCEIGHDKESGDFAVCVNGCETPNPRLTCAALKVDLTPDERKGLKLLKAMRDDSAKGNGKWQ
jgi:hypothetical protein